MIFVFPDDGRAIKCSPKSPKHLENNITAVQNHRPESPGYEYVHTQGDSLISPCISDFPEEAVYMHLSHSFIQTCTATSAS